MTGTGKSRPCTRRDLFRVAFEELAKAFSSAVEGAARPAVEAFEKTRPPRRRFVRPPGALEEERFLELCTRCDACIKACPHWVVRKAGPELGLRVEGTPIVIPAENPCLFCEELPCVAACQPGALVAWPGRRRIGLAVVDAARCYMAQGQPCDYCVKECPLQPKAISLGERGAPAAVDAGRCNGCGECAQLCPPGAIAIEALP